MFSSSELPAKKRFYLNTLQPVEMVSGPLEHRVIHVNVQNITTALFWYEPFMGFLPSHVQEDFAWFESGEPHQWKLTLNKGLLPNKEPFIWQVRQLIEIDELVERMRENGKQKNTSPSLNHLITRYAREPHHVTNACLFSDNFGNHHIVRLATESWVNGFGFVWS